MQKIILKCDYALGDIVMLTAAIRDLHKCYPGRFLTDVQTHSPELWEHNPYITPLSKKDSDVEIVECTYPLINDSNWTPHHALHGFVKFLNLRLGLNIELTALKGDVHLSEEEKTWYSQVHELTGADTPFWIVAGGGKYDLTIKWWQSKRYQEVVNHFQRRTQFVQVGRYGHHHPKLDGTIDLRGKTDLRELIRLVYHSQGVLCPITALMHLAAAVETKANRPSNRPCVVIAGGREPTQWAAYPHHQFIHTIGALPCCATGGCWKDRAVRLRDGDKRDRLENLCIAPQNDLPLCMSLIKSAEVIRRIEGYYQGGLIKYLNRNQIKEAERGVGATLNNEFDEQPLHHSSAGMACDEFVKAIPEYPDSYEGRGIVICGGGERYFVNAWVCIKMLRQLGCNLPIQFWYLGKKEMDAKMTSLLRALGVDCVDACVMRKKHPVRILTGKTLKTFAAMHSHFREILLLDADNVPVVNPEYLFATSQFHSTGAIFWPDRVRKRKRDAVSIWRSFGLRLPNEPEFEAGQILLDKQRCWRALSLAAWMNENGDFFYRFIPGDGETYHLAFRKLRMPYRVVPKRVRELENTKCQYDFSGKLIFQHRHLPKWDLRFNVTVKGFLFEKQCLGYIEELKGIWDGTIKGGGTEVVPRHARQFRRPIRVAALMTTCVERNAVRRRTLRNLARTDWGNWPLHIQFDNPGDGPPLQRQMRSFHATLKKSLDFNADFILILEDDLDFNDNIRYNIANWPPVRFGSLCMGSLYNPMLPEKARDIQNNARIIDGNAIWGSQAFLFSKTTVDYILRRWNDEKGQPDLRIPRLVNKAGKPILFHAPSLVQHLLTQSTWGGGLHRAIDFDKNWKA